MAKYECEHCGMGVADMKCAKCCESLEHDHLKCKICGDLIDVQLFDEQIRNTIKKQYKFEADDVLMTIIGTCHKHNK